MAYACATSGINMQGQCVAGLVEVQAEGLVHLEHMSL